MDKRACAGHVKFVLETGHLRCSGCYCELEGGVVADLRNENEYKCRVLTNTANYTRRGSGCPPEKAVIIDRHEEVHSVSVRITLHAASCL
jgi:hypothetical protein